MRNSVKNHAVGLNAASTQVLGPSPRRRGLILSPTSGGDIHYTFGEAAEANKGITLISTGCTPLRLCVKMGDDFIRGAMFGFSGGAVTAAIVEIIEEGGDL